ncbi:hypothetical protein KFE25_004865 [Diacronema lutheri]|uniref:Exostosin GT47 domain-containing protein n=1 Tax=Diacronema lutheri TaxID=2081491 RepID=A0A8J5XMM0_DIALT|nr:hypothetical protein KFE25_004865 [Diacronema lutheri]
MAGWFAPIAMHAALHAAAAAAARPTWCDHSAPRPRVHVYDLPLEFRRPGNNWRGPPLVIRRLQASAFHERDGRCADFFLLPHFGGKPDEPKVIRMFAHVARAWPYWNATVTERRARHIMQLPCDHGPFDCNFERPVEPGKQPLSALGINPADPDRLVLFFVFNGAADRRTRFAHGTDVRLPTPHKHLCGPLCSYHLAELRELSPWARPPGAARNAELERPRPIKFFWAGSSRHTGDARALLLSNWEGKSGWRVIRLGARSPAAAAVATAAVAAAALRKAKTRPVGTRGALDSIARLRRKQQLREALSAARPSGARASRGFTPSEAYAGPPVALRARHDGVAAPDAPVVTTASLATLRGDAAGWPPSSRAARRLGARARQRRLYAPPAPRKGALPPDAVATVGTVRAPARPNLAREMAAADFCGSPPGWDFGDSDRYLPAVLLGCIPVFFSRHEYRPLEEVIAWDEVSLRVSVEDVERLDEILAAVPAARVVRMRRAMAAVWERLLYSSYAPSFETLGNDFHEFNFGPRRPNVTSYLGEDGSRDAFAGIMDVLRARVQAWERAG